jgi:RNA polymerase sigma-70 factor (ECF subfamily)
LVAYHRYIGFAGFLFSGSLMNMNELHSLARGGDKSAESEMYRRLRVSFLLFLRQKIRDQKDAEDVVQEALLAIADNQGKIEFETSFSAWAYKVLENMVLRHYRSKGRRENVFVAMDGDCPELLHKPDPDLRARLLHCLRELSRTRCRHAQIIHMHVQGLSVPEICAAMNVTSNNLYVMLLRARSLLEECLSKGRIE